MNEHKRRNENRIKIKTWAGTTFDKYATRGGTRHTASRHSHTLTPSPWTNNTHNNVFMSEIITVYYFLVRWIVCDNEWTRNAPLTRSRPPIAAHAIQWQVLNRSNFLFSFRSALSALIFSMRHSTVAWRWPAPSQGRMAASKSIFITREALMRQPRKLFHII